MVRNNLSCLEASISFSTLKSRFMVFTKQALRRKFAVGLLQQALSFSNKSCFTEKICIPPVNRPGPLLCDFLTENLQALQRKKI